MLFNSCYYDNPPEPVPIDPELVSFETHIVPILSRSCSTPSCHDGTTSPNLTKDKAWAELQAGGYVNLTFPKESILYRSVEPPTAFMPPGVALPEGDRDFILAWIIKGALND